MTEKFARLDLPSFAEAALKSALADADTILINDSADGGNPKRVQSSKFFAAFGDDLVYGSEDGETSTTENNYSDPDTRRLRVTRDVVNGQTYLLWWYCELKGNAQNTNVEMRAQIDDGETACQPAHDGDLWNPCSGVYKYTATADESVNLDMDWRVTSGGASIAYIRRARLMMWRLT